MSTDLARTRYGRGRRPWWAITLAVVVIAGLLAWLGWAIAGASDPQVTSTLLSFDVTGEHRASARIQVNLRSADVRATCLLQATAEDHSVVGEIHFDVPRDRGRTVALSQTLRTERTATTVELVGCTAPGQPRAQ